MTKVKFQKAAVDGFNVFYREAGPKDGPTILLLHGFPSSSHMFRDLIPLLADRFHIVAPDLPGFGQSDMPDHTKFQYSFDKIAKVIERFTEVIGLEEIRRLRVRLRRADRLSPGRLAIRSASPPSSPRTATPTRKA